MSVGKYVGIVTLMALYSMIYIATWLQNYTLLYVSLLGFSILLSLLLMRASMARNFTLAIFILTLALSLKILFPRIVIEANPVLVWDDEARANIVEAIIENGHYPFELAGIENSMYRDEYILYPAAFVLAAVTSLTTSLDATTLFTSPVIIMALFVLFVTTSVLLMKLNRVLGWLATISLCLNFVTINCMYPYIYSQVARAYIALLLYILLVKNNRTSFTKSDIIVCVILIALIPLTHSSESIASFIAIATISLIFIMLGSITRNREAKQYFARITIPFIVFIIVFSMWNVFQAKIMAIGIYNMIVHTLEYALKTEVTEAIARYTPYDYTQLELIMMILGILSYGIILLMLSIDTLVAFLRKGATETLELVTIAVLAIIAIVNAYAYLETPYKSDITWRFAYTFFAISSIFFVRKDSVYIGFVKRLLRNRELLLASILIGLFISSMYIYIRFQNMGSEYNTFSLNMRRVLESSKVILLLRKAIQHGYDIIFVDSPAMPYHILRDYIVVRIPIAQYKIFVDKVYIQFYSYRLMNGISMYRYVLLKNYVEASSLHNYVDNAIVLHGLDTCIHRIFNTIYNNGIFGLSIS